ncbi:MAG: hypothetical protein KDK71_07810 [Chlamydiia bacterium]|nr:hypothetical protein [Chlamydiia bacterium]
MISLVSANSRALTFKPFSCKPVRFSHIQSSKSIDHLFKEVYPMKIMSKEEFMEKKCMSIDNFTKQYGKLVEKKGLLIEEAFHKMVEGQYNNYIIHSKIIEPGRIC